MNDNLLIFFGVVIGLAFGLSVPDMIRSTASASEYWAFAGAGLGAAITVLGALAVAKHQTKTRRKELDENRRRRQRGARAILASDLSQIVGYAEDCTTAAIRGARINEGEEERTEVRCPVLETDLLLRLQSLVELLEGDDAGQVVDLMHCYQVQRARLNAVLEDLNNPAGRQPPGLILTRNNFTHTLLATVELYLRAEVMFPFARGEHDDSIVPPPFLADRVENAFRILNVHDWLEEIERNHIREVMINLPSLGRWHRN